MKFARVGFWAFFLLSSIQGIAVDLDVEGAKRRWDNQQALANQAESTYRGFERDFQREQGVYLQEVSRQENARRVVEDKERELQILTSRVTNLENDVPSLEQEVRTLQNRRINEQSKFQSAQRDEQDAEKEVRRDRVKLNRAEKDLEAEQAKPTPDPARVASLTAEKVSAEAAFRHSESEHRRAEGEVRRARERLENTDQQIRRAENNLSDKQTDLAQARRQRQDKVMEIQNAREDLRQQNETVQLARGRVDAARRDMNQAKTNWDREALLAQQARENYDRVQANYTAARNRVIADARSTGSTHGDREGAAADRGPSAGLSAGRAVAINLGKRVGEDEARVREERKGYRMGRENASQDAASYQVGIGEGQAIADRKARAEDFARGYNDAMASTLASVPSNEVSVDVPEVLTPSTGPSEDGGQWLSANPMSAGSLAAPAFPILPEPAVQTPKMPPAGTPSIPESDKRFYSVNCSGVPLVEFESLCRSTYENAYLAAYRGAYTRSYQDSYQTAFTQGIEAEYQKGLSTSYPSEFQSAMGKGAKEQGILDGFAGKLAVARVEQYGLGRAAWDAYLGTGHLIRFREAKLTETSGDQLLTPGESGALSLVVDNFGKKPVPESALIALAGAQSGFGVSDSPRGLPSLAGASRTTVNGIVYGKVLPAMAGAQLKLGAKLVRSGSELHQVTAGSEVHFPVELQSIQLAKVPQVDQEVDATLVFKNRLAQKVGVTPFKMGASPVIASVAGNPLEIPEVEAGQEVSVPVKVKPGVWVGGNIPVNFTVETTGLGGISGAIAQKFPHAMEIDRHSSLLLYDMAGKPAPLSGLVAQAGRSLQFQVLFQTHTKTPQRGPFYVRASSTSDPSLKNSDRSTVGTTYTSPSFGTSKIPLVLSYDVPLSLKGKSAWVLVSLSQAGKFLHVLQVPIDVR
jgi:hypothetical protein